MFAPVPTTRLCPNCNGGMTVAMVTPLSFFDTSPLGIPTSPRLSLMSFIPPCSIVEWCTSPAKPVPSLVMRSVLWTPRVAMPRV